MLSRKTRYAMLAMTSLAKARPQKLLSIREIADSERIPPRMLESILLKLKNRGYLHSARGKAGGYRLSRRPDQITLLEIVLLFEGSVSMLACVCEDVYRPCEFCKDEASCPIRSTFSSIYRHAIQVLGSTTFAALADGTA